MSLANIANDLFSNGTPTKEAVLGALAGVLVEERMRCERIALSMYLADLGKTAQENVNMTGKEIARRIYPRPTS